MPNTRELLIVLKTNPDIRAKIRANPGQTLLYAGEFFKPMWKEIADLKRSDPQMSTKETLPDVLSRVIVSGRPVGNLLDWAKKIDDEVPWKENGFIAWRALSGIFASNAVGSVSFYVGSRVSADKKVFPTTELSVLARNPQIDELTRDILCYYQRCLRTQSRLQTGNVDMNFGFIGG
jgi:hypothetical protein